MFESIQKWEPDVVPRHIYMWERIRGFPLHICNEVCFEGIFAKLSNLVKVDDETSSLSILEFARLLVRMEISFTISSHKRVQVKGGIYLVSILLRRL